MSFQGYDSFVWMVVVPIIKPTEQKNPRLFGERVCVIMTKALNVIVTDHSYQDAALDTKTTKHGVNSGVIL